ncbi:hypothetical protein CY652_17300 [Burkholderia sp. WAC0059]|uniref:BspC domain-containing protein n=1 Tax=Burkholderia sp. WAC0059 TaxID=2066022 RepID=UPI000C7F0468|nr:hypothetical protein [Burkholderia sp. WAC0059]PLZ01047.1 hypothetical protein CY652_17300 [Burkholderia sp. WAC0059]
MDSNQASRRLLKVISRLAACVAGVTLACTLPAHADQLEQHNELVSKFINELHADPLVADCAAHGDFVASTVNMFDHVEFPPDSFDSPHASVTPWNDSFNENKQRIKVDTIVSVDGIGIPSNSSNAPIDLKFRCGYVGNQMLAFSWNDPQPSVRAVSERGPAAHGARRHRRGKQPAASKRTGKGKPTGKIGKRHAPGKAAANGKTGTKKAARKKKAASHD